MKRLGWVVAAVAAMALPALTANTYYLYLAASVGLLVIVTAGLNVLAGFTGQISLGHAGFYAIGAYAGALCLLRLGLPGVAAVIVGIALAAAVGAAVAAAALRVSGPYLAMVTIAFGIIVEGVLVEWVSVTGGPGGIFNIPRPPLKYSYWVVLGSAAAALWLVANLRRSAWGRAFLAVKGSEIAAESLGLSAYFVRIVAFTVSAAFTGAAGALFAFLNGYISPDSFTLQTSILFLLALLFGGLGSTAGPLLGAIALTVLPELLVSLSDYRLILYGALLLVSIYWLPAGVVGAFARGAGHSLSSRSPSPRLPLTLPSPLGGEGSRVPSPPPQGRGQGEGERVQDDGTERLERGGPDRELLVVDGVRMAFGGVVALAEVTVSVPASGIHAVIGPNGAGKTTLLNVLSGYYTPQSGAVILDGAPMTGRPPYAVARLGVARTFQTAQLFPDLTVAENVAVGVAGPRLGSLLGALLGTPAGRRREAELAERALALLRSGGLAEWADLPADALPAGHRRRLEIARALATGPRLLMLDEPAAGLGPAEIEELDAQLTALRDRGGPAIVLVEHHMDLVMNVSDRISVLDDGRVIASGSPASVRENAAVVEAYLGAPA